jgi:rhodanese-related sulfurtransferase
MRTRRGLGNFRIPRPRHGRALPHPPRPTLSRRTSSAHPHTPYKNTLSPLTPSQKKVKEGRVKSVDAKAAGALQKEGWVILDVRPPSEVAKAGVAGAVTVPVYVEEAFDSLPNLMKHASWFGMGGWWLGGVHMKPNPDFLRGVEAAVPKSARVVVACQKGLRSLAAAEQLARAGYGDLAWINGGLDSAAPGDLGVVGAPDLRFGGIGGLSEKLGWTDVQREQGASGFLGGSQNIIYGALVVLALDGIWFAVTTGQEMLAAMNK